MQFQGTEVASEIGLDGRKWPVECQRLGRQTVGMTVVVSSKKVGAAKLKRACRVMVTMSVEMWQSWTRRWTPSCCKYCRFRHCTVAVGRGFRVTEWTEIVDESFAKRICAGGKVSCVACHKFWLESEARRCRKGDGGTAESESLSERSEVKCVKKVGAGHQSR